MRLTDYMRKAFVTSAMNDVPRIDYQEQIKDAVNAVVLDMQIAAGIDEITSNRLYRSYIYVGGQSYYVNGLLEEERQRIPKALSVTKLVTQFNEQDKTSRVLRDKLTGAINACTTRKQAVEAFPEFEKYLPEDEAKVLRPLPVISNILSEFVKAGWPKEQKRVTI